MRILLFFFIFLLAALILIFAWVVWPSNPVVFGKENVPLASLDEKVNRLADSIYTFRLDGSDEELVATLVEFRSDSVASRAVLYIHGFGDYFFHPHLAEWFLERNMDFYALDLRRYGRSLRAGSQPCYTRSVVTYYEEIQRALQQMELSGYNRIGLLGHSTGGLISSLYAAEGPGRDKLDVLILNSK
jgi:pimeloyl-ACP methyl ester carboxylesterase